MSMMYLVSACLAGYPCRYDGQAAESDVIRKLVDAGQAVPICPEQLGGLPTPRPACEVVTGQSGVRQVFGKDGSDLTDEFNLGAEATLAVCRALGITRAILKSKSPTCGCGTIYDGTFSGRVVSGDGVTAELLKRNGIEVLTEFEIGE